MNYNTAIEYGHFQKETYLQNFFFHCYLYVSLPKCRVFFIVIPPNMGIFFSNPEHILNRGMLGEKFPYHQINMKKNTRLGAISDLSKVSALAKTVYQCTLENGYMEWSPSKNHEVIPVIPYNRLLPKKLPFQQTIIKDLGKTGSETFSGIGVLGAPDASGGNWGLAKISFAYTWRCERKDVFFLLIDPTWTFPKLCHP